MNSTGIDDLAALVAQADAVLGGLLDSDEPSRCSDDELITVLTLAGRLVRRVESVAIEASGAVVERSRTGDVEARMTSRFGCHDVSELLQRTTLAGAPTVSRWQRSARAVGRDTSVTTGELLAAPLPAMREALLAGDVGVDGLLAVSGALSDLERRVDRAAVLAADAALAAAARGEGPDQAPPACADLLKVHASAWAAVLDQDGSEPRERQGLWRRYVTLGPARDGLVAVRGALLPEVAAQLRRIFDALCAPRVADDTGGVRFVPEGAADGGPADGTSEAVGLAFTPPDERRAGQRRHDALATALLAAAASAGLPTIGGAAPTLVVSVRESDLRQERGLAHVDGCDEPLPIFAARHIACTGVTQQIVLSAEGRILRIGTEERVFNRHQRRAIALRDGGCLIPGCGVPASWCEIHHVIEHAAGGPTHTDNGASC